MTGKFIYESKLPRDNNHATQQPMGAKALGFLFYKLLYKSQGEHMKSFRPAGLAFAIATIVATPSTYLSAAEQITEEQLVVGSRTVGRTAEELPVPVDLLSSESLERTGQIEVGRMLQALAPSFNFSTSAISDGTDALRPATLRGLGPDQTLVLINGKRRHQASLIHINTSVGRGTAGTDMNAIPAASIQRIEVLRDGAAAQYGSDAIAGVINIVLKDSAEDGKVDVSYGQYSEGDGATTNINVNNGFELGNSGFFNATLNYREREFTNRAGLHGSCQFSGCSETSPGVNETVNEREINADRSTFRIGDADSTQIGIALNAAAEVGDGELYGFVTYSNRENESAAFFRHNNNTGGNTPLADGDATIPAGFLPIIGSEITDVSYNVGYNIAFNDDSTLDISYTTGSNKIDYTTSNTINASFANELRFGRGLTDAEIRAQIPREGEAYGLELGLTTFNIDYTKNYGDVNVAMGAEIRSDEYKVIPGEKYGYFDYDTVNGESIYPVDSDAGLQGFGGIGPASEVEEERDVFSFYIDTEYSPTDDLILSAAVRHDNYDGFGDTNNVKLAGNYAINDLIRVRAATSTGFRAPSMQQLYFNNVSTQFRPGAEGGPQVAEQVGTFRNDSELARALGIPELTEEKSTNWSAGFILTPTVDLSISVDFYEIEIEDRIVISNQLSDDAGTPLGDALLAAGAGSGQFFLNGADTETKGVDIIATYGFHDLLGGNLELTLAGNFTETEVTSLFTPDTGAISSLSADEIFSEQDISIIEEWQPQDRISFSSYYSRGPLSVNLALNRYGEYTVTDGDVQTYGAKMLTDVTLDYSVTDSLSFKIVGNNIFDVYPDETTIGRSRNGTIIDGNTGDTVVDSNGVFVYSRRSAPFGFNGAYYSAGVTYSF